MKKRITDETDHSGAERYLITYADLITLLLGLFVILYASSQTDSSKYQEISAAMKSYFENNRGKGILPGGKGVLPGIVYDTTFKSNVQIAEEMRSALSSFGMVKGIEIAQNSSNIILKLPEQLLFKPGKSDVEPLGRSLLDSVASVLRGLQQSVTIDGHTDSIPMRTFQYESNWHLSVDRALTVGYYLLQHGVSPAKTSIRGFGAERPAASNSTLEGRAKNRRVEIVISLPEVVKEEVANSREDTSDIRERFFQN
ncbi:MAG TPA: OmpA family protein [Patescibacteria group bacterium]|nr:OmpA family protein [Patescibacteria group bacterium]